MKVGGQILWNVTPICETSQIYHLMGRRPMKDVLGNHLKDRNCEICQRTNITRAPCRRRNGEALPRAENFGELITADHKVLSEGCESRNNHRYAVVVQDSATQWMKISPGIIGTSTPQRSETNGVAERAVRRVKEGTSRFYGMLHLSAKRHRSAF